MAEVLQKTFAKLTRGLDGKIQFDWNDLDKAFSRKVVERRPRDVETFGVVAESILSQIVTLFNYRKLESDFSELRRVHPLHLGEVDDGWYFTPQDTFQRPQGFAGNE